MKRRILTLFGTRPEAIKLSAVIKELETHPADFESLVGVTGQHDDLLKGIEELKSFQPPVPASPSTGSDRSEGKRVGLPQEGL